MAGITCIEQWDYFEISMKSAKTFTRPFHDLKLSAVFSNEDTHVKYSKIVSGFYDGNNIWKIRFMPEVLGFIRYKITSDYDEFDGQEGVFECTAPTPVNHGPIIASKKHHFGYQDGTPFFAMGTTAYVWHYRPEEIRQQTLASFSKYGFNKIRMLFFPKYYVGEFKDVDISYEPPCYPFAGEPKHFDFQTPNPDYFRNFEERVRDLRDLNIQADIILFHVYDFGRWDIASGMSNADDLFYIRYLVARLAAFRNVWWSLANEYDLFFQIGKIQSQLKSNIDGWSMLGEYVKIQDPYNHPISIHNFPYGPVFPDKEWMTHVSYQSPNTYSMLLDLRTRYNKPVINDEYQYEGNVRDEWGNTSTELELFRHWLTAFAGGYGTHGEAFVNNCNTKDIFWAYGGTLVGGCPPRLLFMKQILESCPFQEMDPEFTFTDSQNSFGLSDGQGTSLYFFRHSIPGKRLRYGFFEDKSSQYLATVYDVWNCKINEQLMVGPDHTFDVAGWTVIKLQKILDV